MHNAIYGDEEDLFSSRYMHMNAAIGHGQMMMSQMNDRNQGCGVLWLMEEMKKRHASNELDKIAGLSYLL